MGNDWTGTDVKKRTLFNPSRAARRGAQEAAPTETREREQIKEADRHDWARRKNASDRSPRWRCRRCGATTHWSVPQVMTRYERCPGAAEERQ